MFLLSIKPTEWHAVIVESIPVQNTCTNNGFRWWFRCNTGLSLTIKHDVHVRLHTVIIIYSNIDIFKHAKIESISYRSHD